MTAAWYCPVHGRQDSDSEIMPPRCQTPVGNHRCGAELFHSTAGKHYPTDPRGAEDAGTWVPDKPCCNRLNTKPLSWCTLPSGHDGPCHAEGHRPLESDDFLGRGHTKHTQKPKEPKEPKEPKP